ncbi:MAG: DUF2240 family protein [Candidatus Diapherotrites archaeon]|nr:DUF2240 family protein [Candidatus Diapherotrites archaeon]
MGFWVQENTSVLIDRIASESGKPKQEILEKIESKKEKFAGLLTESGAALMVAKELGLEIDKNSKRLKIAQLEDGMSNIDLLVRVMQVFAPREFEKNGKKGRLCNLVVADDSGEIRLTLWHDDVKKMQEQGIERGSILQINNCYVTSFKDRVQLNLSYQGKFLSNQKKDAGFLPKIENKILKLDELRAGLNDVSVIARVLRVFPANEFKKDTGTGRVVNFMVADKTNTIRATAWNDLTREVEKLVENDLIKIEGGYTKEGMKGIELHLGYSARLLKNPKTGETLPSAMELRGAEVVQKKISNLHEQDGTVEIQGKISEIGKGKLYFSKCKQCGKKVIQIDESYLCENCGEQKEAESTGVVSVRIEDGTGSVNTVYYGENAEKLIGLGMAELKKRVAESSAEQVIEELKPKIIGKKIVARGPVKQNSFSGELEITCRNFEFAD